MDDTKKAELKKIFLEMYNVVFEIKQELRTDSLDKEMSTILYITISSKSVSEWENKDYVPKSGDIIFFEWEVDGDVNYVGIVEKVENNIIYTIRIINKIL